MGGARSTIKVHALIDGLGFGGAEALLADFALGAPAAGVELSVGYLLEKDGSPLAARLRQRGVEPEQAPITGLLKPSAFRSVRRQLADRRPDVVHTHLGYSDLLGGAAARSLGIPAVASVHTMEWERGTRDDLKLRLMGLARRACAWRTITVSDAARRAFLDAGWESPARVVTIHNGIAAQPRDGAGAAVRSELGLGPDDLVAAMVAVLRLGKGHDVAIEAVGRLRERFPLLRLVVVGDGPARAEVERLAAPLGDTVVMAGHREDVMAILDASDVVVHPSRVDAFPGALLEAMAASVPVVATSVGGIPEIVEPDVTGLLFEPPPDAGRLSAALEPLLGDPERRRRLGAAGRERFEAEFTVERWAERLREVYEGAIAARGRR